ncbi:Uncharacterised protein [Mycobacterium tuberculosis]|nr:Uncharacterised protein [Mycobacterium tuberculosis]
MTPSFPRTGVSGHAGAVQGRQTQNPERGRKHSESHVLTADSHVVRPKTPRGDGNQVSNGGGNLAATGRSSDPKPREGTETGQRSTPALVDFRVVRPKTPRGDGNLGYLLPARGDAVRGRQTQNPERGRKLLTMRLPRALFQPSSDPKPREGTETGSRQTGSRRSSPVVRPKTPRGDGNAPWMADALCAQVSSDPKPREGTET